MPYPCGRDPMLLNLLVILMLYLNSSHAQSSTVNPLQESDVLKTYRLGNHIQCQRLCWYRKLCARYSFSYTNGDNPEGSTNNCVLHASNVTQGQLMEGWISQLASEEYMPESHPCKKRTCGDLEVCLPGFDSKLDRQHTCVMAQHTDMNDCASSPCVNNATCHDLINEYNCTCAPGFNGTNCETDVRTCLSGWTRFGVSCYQFQPKLIPYNEAKSHCEAMNSSLAEIDSEVESRFVSNLTEASTVYEGQSYIGLNDMATEGVFVLTSSDRLPSFTYWKSGQPDNWNNEDCVTVGKPTSSLYPKWNDAPCGSLLSSVCEYSLE